MIKVNPYWHPSLQNLALALQAFEPLVVIVAALIAYALRYDTIEDIPHGYYLLAAGGTFGYFGFATLFGLYRASELRNLVSVTLRIMAALFLSFSSLVTLLFLEKVSHAYSRMWVVTWLCTSIVALFITRGWVLGYINNKMKGGAWRRQVAILGLEAKAERLMERFSESSSPDVNLVGVYALEDEASNKFCMLEPFKGTIDDMVNDCRAGRIDDVILAVDVNNLEAADKLLNRLHMLSVNVFFCLPTSLFGVTSQTIYGPVIILFRRPLEGPSLLFKRALDVVASSLILITLLPVLAVFAVLIKLTSPGPVFFRQKRNGFNGAEFEMLKFRSMRTGAAAALDKDGKEKQARKDDDRITPLGRFMRKSSVDELPQLINVLRGNMSLVGPRPHAVSHNTHYEALIERYASRHKMKPGLTGWAQINGWRGETETIDKMAKRIELDIWYIENWSLLLDLKIMVMTPLVVFFQRQAY